MRINYGTEMPEAQEAMRHLQQVVEASGLEPGLLELVKIRASQINGCAFCLDMHTRDALAIGEEPQRLHLLAAWREAPGFTARERAALAWCESLTLIADTGAPDATYEEVAAQFSPREMVALTTAVVLINGWNRLAVGFRSPVGSYRSKRQPARLTEVPTHS
ncbi:MAG: carboxymuconolactone decarboxylase family protein [Candidatus Dormibacteraceae bacterium]